MGGTREPTGVVVGEEGSAPIELLCCSFDDVLRARPAVRGVIADPPWSYDRKAGNGGTEGQYQGITDPEISAHLDATYDLAPEDAYLIVWCTFPKLLEWTKAAHGMRWRYITGGAWTKANGFGVGYHAAGDAEIALYYAKGSPRPADGRQTNAWHADRVGHSEKPQAALEAMVRTVAPLGGVILDPYAGESASLARACARLGRGYIGCEIDPERHATALRRLDGESATQARMTGQATLFTHGGRR